MTTTPTVVSGSIENFRVLDSASSKMGLTPVTMMFSLILNEPLEIFDGTVIKRLPVRARTGWHTIDLSGAEVTVIGEYNLSEQMFESDFIDAIPLNIHVGCVRRPRLLFSIIFVFIYLACLYLYVNLIINFEPVKLFFWTVEHFFNIDSYTKSSVYDFFTEGAWYIYAWLFLASSTLALLTGTYILALCADRISLQISRWLRPITTYQKTKLSSKTKIYLLLYFAFPFFLFGILYAIEYLNNGDNTSRPDDSEQTCDYPRYLQDDECIAPDENTTVPDPVPDEDNPAVPNTVPECESGEKDSEGKCMH